MNSPEWFATVRQYLHQGTRRWARQPLLALSIIATMTLCIGATTAAFGIIDRIVLQPLPFPDSNRLVWITETAGPIRTLAFSYPDYLDCRNEANVFSQLAAWRNQGGTATIDNHSFYADTKEISANFFTALDVPLKAGRPFTQAEDEGTAPHVAILTDTFARAHFASEAAALGTSFQLNGDHYTVIGIAPSQLRVFGPADLFTPLGQDHSAPMRNRGFHPGIRVFGRIKPGITRNAAAVALEAIGTRLAAQYPTSNHDHSFSVVPLKSYIVGDIAPTLLLVGAAIAFVLLIGCANVAGLLLAHSISRDREFAVMTALGCSRSRLGAQLAIEGVLLSLTGGALGLLAAYGATRWIFLHLPVTLPRPESALPNLTIIGFTALLSLGSGLLFGLLPAFSWSRHSAEVLQQGQRTSIRGVRRFHRSLLIIETALTFSLLSATGLMIRTLQHLWSVNPGFDPQDVILVDVGIAPKAASTPAQIRNVWNELLREVQSVPGVESAALSTLVPLTGQNAELGYSTTEHPIHDREIPQATIYTPSPDYFRTLRIAVLRGRVFSDADVMKSQHVAIIDQHMASDAFPNGDALGNQLHLQFLGEVTVVGIVSHVKETIFSGDNGSDQLYIPFAQIPDPFMQLTAGGTTVVVRTKAGATGLLSAVQQSLVGPDAGRPIKDIHRMDDMIIASLARRRLLLVLLGAFSLAAVILTLLGTYSAVSFAALHRAKEMGIRIALGAEPYQIARAMTLEWIGATLAGILVGLVGSVALGRVLVHFLFHVSPTDPITMTMVSLSVLAVALLASYYPVRKIIYIPPMEVLRYE